MRFPTASIILAAIAAPLTSAANIVETAKSTDFLTTLVAALETTGLDDVLSAPGPFTVFAPTDIAFGELTDAVPELVTLLFTEGWALHLSTILSYHVAAGNVTSGDLSNGPINMLSEETVDIDLTNGVTVNDALGGVATVTTPDVFASNGVVHVVDSVLLPSFLGINIIDAGQFAGEFNVLLSLLDRVGLTSTFQELGEKGYTVFAPVDAAFDGIDASALTDDEVTSILTYHVLDGVTPSTLLSDGGTAKTLNGESLAFSISGDIVEVNDAQVIDANALTNNGIVHVIDGVLIPTPGGGDDDKPPGSGDGDDDDKPPGSGDGDDDDSSAVTFFSSVVATASFIVTALALL